MLNVEGDDLPDEVGLSGFVAWSFNVVFGVVFIEAYPKPTNQN